MAENLKRSTINSVAWSGLERIFSGGILFLSNIILARILTPEDFGLLAVIMIFIQIAQVFIDSGFNNALIQKKDRTQKDYSTVFFFNLGISAVLYIALYFFAPLIAKFFSNFKLVTLTRVVGLNLVIGSLVAVHRTRMTVELQFKLQSIITLTSSFVASCVAICLAYYGVGIWSLVALSLINISIQTILFFVLVNWHPSFVFSTKAFKGLFSYSSKLLGASLIHLLYRNIYPIVIGKKFSPLELGYFNRADTFAMYGPQIIGQTVSRVAFPIFSRIQDNNEKLKYAYSKYIAYTSLVIFPIMIGLISLAKPLTILVLKDKWLPMVPMFQILCIDWMTDHICSINLNVLYVKGRSDLALKLEIVKKILAIIIFIISLYWGIIGVCWGRVIYSIGAIYINAYYTNRLIGFSLLSQLRDVLKPLILALTMGIIVYVISRIIPEESYKILLGGSSGIFSYVTLVYLFERQFIKDLISLKK